MLTVLAIFISLCATTVGAISGLGGGIFIKPLLDLTSINVSTIGFLSNCTVFAMAVANIYKKRNTKLNFKLSIVITLSIGSIIGGIIGQCIFGYFEKNFTNTAIIKVVQNIFLCLIVIFTIVYLKYKKKMKTYDLKNMFSVLFAGLILGAVSAFLGIGGGPLNIAVLAIFFSMRSKDAANASLIVIFFSQLSSLATTFIDHSVPEFNSIMLIGMVIAGVTGAFIGGKLQDGMDDDFIDKLFAGTLFFILTITIFNIVRAMLAL